MGLKVLLFEPGESVEVRLPADSGMRISRVSGKLRGFENRAGGMLIESASVIPVLVELEVNLAQRAGEEIEFFGSSNTSYRFAAGAGNVRYLLVNAVMESGVPYYMCINTACKLNTPSKRPIPMGPCGACNSGEVIRFKV